MGTGSDGRRVNEPSVFSYQLSVKASSLTENSSIGQPMMDTPPALLTAES